MSKPGKPNAKIPSLSKKKTIAVIILHSGLFFQHKLKGKTSFIPTRGGGAAATKGYCSSPLCCGKKRTPQQFHCGVRGCCRREGREVEVYARLWTCEDFHCFTASSGLEHFSSLPPPPSFPPSLPSLRHHSLHSAAFIGSASGGARLPEEGAILAECEHCSYMSVLNRDVNTNGFWQGPGPRWTHCWSRKKTSGGKEGQGREEGRGLGQVQEKDQVSWRRRRLSSLALQQHHLSLRGRALQRGITAAQHTSDANNPGRVLVLLSVV